MKRKILIFFCCVFFCLSYTNCVFAATVKKPEITVTAASASSVKISWKKVSGAKTITLYRSTKKNSGYKKIKTYKKNSAGSYTDKSVSFGKQYYYKLKATTSKNKSTNSAVKGASVGQVQKPTAKSTANGITVSWKKISGSTGYALYVSTDNGKSYKKKKTTKSNSAAISGLKCGQTVYFKVRAFKTSKSKTVYAAYSSAGKQKSLAHAYSEWSVSQPAGCEQAGTETRTCFYCGSKQVKNSPAVGHTFEKVQETAPSCQQDGQIVYSCTSCSMETTEILPHSNAYHRFVTQTVQSTCLDNGYTQRVCTECGAIEGGSYQILPIAPHSITNEPTLIMDDGTACWMCSVCNQIVKTEVFYE